ncbi:alpha/beta hydrolase [Pigmentiphaga litoralis]|uniref:Acetyl esterase/lipase n=1 Tax=Pigmentiphaga litoralis TaxID=516702 RepID=A0A7Y9IRN8_9BURK|nr:alpha/beta hydrolase [Pigmentiphaga litoralis]NYE25293.1 acetyl esterase/lipase [Pigmentiphaga litoralis]NYE81094.1 acetyl esterase/lipase [Pigmentiphaga litoralis]
MFQRTLLSALLLACASAASHAADVTLVDKVGQCPNASPAGMRPDEVALFRQLQIRGAQSMQDATRVYYGEGLDQYGDLRLPKGTGPFPLAIVVHGGSWKASVNSDYTAPVAKLLTDAGIATWNIEYSRLGSGGEWPGSFKSVAAAADYVRVLAERYPIDLKRVISIGHSSGGHYALWLAGRHKLNASAPGYAPTPLKLVGVVSLDGTPDLRAFAALPRGKTVIPELLNSGADPQWEKNYAVASPVDLLPLGVPQYFLTQESDRLASIMSYMDKGKQGGDTMTYDIACPSSHFVTADTQSPAIAGAIVKASKAFVK